MKKVNKNKRTKKEIRKIVNNLGYSLLSEYVSKNRCRRVVIRDKRGYKYDIGLSSLGRRDRGIRIVHIRNPYSLENIRLWLKINKKNARLCLKNIYEGKDKKLLFYCNKITCGETFNMSWHDVLGGSGCPYCAGKKIGKYNTLIYKRPDLEKEWDYSKNGKTTPYNVTCGSHEKVWWLCPEGHSHQAIVSNRTIGNSGCKICSDDKKESKIARELKIYCIKNLKAEKIEKESFIHLKTGYPLIFDIYIQSKKVFIEVNGDQHYRICRFHYLQAKRKGTTPNEEFEYQKKKDRVKRKYARKNGVYIEVDLRKIKTTEKAIEYVLNKISNI